MPILNEIDAENGCVLIINKPLHWTSFDVVNKLRYHLQKNLHLYKTIQPGQKPKIKVGHAGTLDPLATGVLLVCIGKETKNIDQYMATEKTYTGSIFLGATTASYDLETEPENFQSIQHLTHDLIENTAKQFEGALMQFPPMHSAIKKDGKRLYEHARAGEVVEINPRPIQIMSFKIVEIKLPEVLFEVTCSKGTYIRSLAHDFGKALQCGGYLAGLCRTQNGIYPVSQALSIDEALSLIQTTTASV